MSSTPTTYTELVTEIIDIINYLIPAIFALAFLYFVWKIIDSWVLGAGDQNKIEEGKKYATAAVIAFVIMVSAWGIVWLIRQSLFGF